MVARHAREPSLSQRILAVLGESPLPVSTPDLVLLCGDGFAHPRAQLWNELRVLLAAGLVAKAGKLRRRDEPWMRAATLWRVTR